MTRETEPTTPAKPPVWAYLVVALSIAALTLALGGCTTVREGGKVVFSTSSNLRGVHFKSANGTVLDCDSVNNSTVHAAIGNNIAKGATALGAAVATAGLVP